MTSFYDLLQANKQPDLHATDALARVAPDFDNEVDAALSILERAARGVVIANCAAFTHLNLRDGSPRWRRPEGPGVIEQFFWKGFLEMWSKERSLVHMDWNQGYFELTTYLGTNPFNLGSTTQRASGVRFSAAGLPPLRPLTRTSVATESPTNKSASSVSKNGGGRPLKHDWPGAQIHLIAIADGVDGLHPDGTDAITAAHIQRLLTKYFEDKQAAIPGDSQLEEHARRIKQGLDEHKSR